MPGALTWDPTPPGGSQSTSRGGVNPAADGASLNSTEVAVARALVSEAGDYADLSLLAGWALAAAGPGYLFHDGRALLHDGQPLASL